MAVSVCLDLLLTPLFNVRIYIQFSERSHTAKLREAEAVGWCQLAVGGASNLQCQCADGNVMRYGERAYRVLAIDSTSEAQNNVTADGVVHQLFVGVNATMRFPGEPRPVVRTLGGKEGYCAQICFKEMEPLERLLELVCDIFIYEK